MIFIFIIFLTALLMEGSGTYLSILGLGSFFSYELPILFIIAVLDLAKVVTVSFLYQYWKDVNRLMKSYMSTSILILMLITSIGTFGYLSQSFQKTVQPAQEIILKVETFKREKISIEAERAQLNEQKVKINEQIARLPDDVISGRQRLIASFRPEQNRINSRLGVITKRGDELNKEILAVEHENIARLVHVGPISYVAKAFNISMEEASKYIILTIIFVFDPLAIMLVVAGNFLIVRKKVIPKEIPKKELKPELKLESKSTPGGHLYKMYQAPKQPEITQPLIQLVAQPKLAKLEPGSELKKTELAKPDIELESELKKN